MPVPCIALSQGSKFLSVARVVVSLWHVNLGMPQAIQDLGWRFLCDFDKSSMKTFVCDSPSIDQPSHHSFQSQRKRFPDSPLRISES
jgi:hypothetical protein